jgi:hypothetical protein
MTQEEKYRLWLQAAALFVQLVTVVLVVLQLASLRRSIRSQTYQRIYEVMIGIDRFFFEHKGLRPYFYPHARGLKKEVDEKESNDEKVSRDELDSLTEMMVDYFDNVYYQRKCMPNRRAFEAFSEYMRSVYHHSEEMQHFIEDRRPWYPSEFIKHLAIEPRLKTARVGATEISQGSKGS